MSETLNDKAWKKIFSKYNIIENVNKNKSYEITSKQINEFREARLMTKFDHRKNLPKLFQQNNLSILPITRGKYIISNFEAYHDFENKNEEIISVDIPDFVQSIDFENITSESTAINVAYISGILADFVGEETLLPTVNGRMSSESFDFNICDKIGNNLQNITVLNSQIEIDGGYEGIEYLTLIEAKNAISDDFLVRQLYYPYRLWNDKVEKSVKPIFLIYSNGIFNLYEYEFKELNNYNSLTLINQKNYTLEKEDISIDEIVELYDNVKVINEPEGIPFPQADDFKRVINICELLYEKESLSREEITYKYDFDIRQTNYYTDACRYLGLIYKKRDKKEGIIYYLTEKGKKFFLSDIKKRRLLFAESILEKRVFNEVFNCYLRNYELPKKKDIVTIMMNSGIHNICAEETYKRRASTVVGWINWIFELGR